MNTFKLIFLAIALLSAGLAQGQDFTNYTYTSGTLNTTIPDGSAVGISEVANVGSLPGYVTNVTVNLDITGGFNGDLYAYLTGPGGQIAILLNRVGVSTGNPVGYSDAGFNITLANGFANIHNYQSGSYTLSGGQLINTWGPDGRHIDPQSAGSAFTSASTSSDFSALNNYTLPSGDWTLFLADMSAGNQSTLVSWGLTISTVPEPQTWAMLAGGAGVLFMMRRRSSR